MKISDLFRAALQESLKVQGISQKKLSDDLGISPVLMNDFLKNRKNFSEDRMSIISKYFNVTLFEMLSLGQELISNSTQPKPDILTEVKIKVSDVAKKLEALNQQDLKLMNDMATRLTKNIGDD